MKGRPKHHTETLYLPRRGQGPKRIVVEHRNLALPVILESYVITPPSPEMRIGRLAREVAHLLRDEPLRFPQELRSDA